MACPYFNNSVNHNDDNGAKPEEKVTYSSYLQLDKILTARAPLSYEPGNTPVHDEHLFVTVHQSFELWFYQILLEVNSVRKLLTNSYLEERNMLVIISRLNRVHEITQLFGQHFTIIETMTPQSFLEFRDHLERASGFQSFQFRLLEIRFGVQEDLRISYNKDNYKNALNTEQQKQINQALSENSLFQLVNNWLERTPGLEKDGFDFFTKLKSSVDGWLHEIQAGKDENGTQQTKEEFDRYFNKTADTFKSLFSEKEHLELMKTGERRFTHKALQGALMIFMYHDEPRFHLPFQFLRKLMDLDGQMTKWRYSHACMVQRMIGSKLGTGQSSGYRYLRSTCSDRYKVFLDLVNLASFLVPSDRIPQLNSPMKRSLSIHDCLSEDTANKLSVKEDLKRDCGVNGDRSSSCV